jgi:hypothetical protein
VNLAWSRSASLRASGLTSLDTAGRAT